MSNSTDKLWEDTPEEPEWRLPRRITGLQLAHMAHRLVSDRPVVVEPEDVAVEGPWDDEERRWHVHAKDEFVIQPTRMKWGHRDPEFQPYVFCRITGLGSAVIGGRGSPIQVGLPECMTYPLAGPEELARQEAAQEELARQGAARQEATRQAPRHEAERQPTVQEARVGLVVLGLATLGMAVLVNGITGNPTVAFLACVAFFGAGLQYGDRFLKP